jgi:hypothetical protein
VVTICTNCSNIQITHTVDLNVSYINSCYFPKSVNKLVFVIEVSCVVWEVGTEIWCNSHINFKLEIVADRSNSIINSYSIKFAEADHPIVWTCCRRMVPYVYTLLHKSVQRRQVQDATVFALTHRSDNSFSMSIPYERLAFILSPKNIILSRCLCFPLHVPRISHTSRQREGQVLSLLEFPKIPCLKWDVEF